MNKKNSKNLKTDDNSESLDDQDYKNDPKKDIDNFPNQGSLSFKELSNRMRRNMQKIDILVQNGFEVKGLVKEQILSDPDGVPVNLWDWVPFIGIGLPGNNRDQYENYQFPRFSWLTFIFPLAMLWKIKNWSYVRLIIAVDIIYEILIRYLNIDFTDLFAKGSGYARIYFFSTIAIWGFHIVLGQIYPYLVWNSLNKKIKNFNLFITILVHIIYTSLFFIF